MLLGIASAVLSFGICFLMLIVLIRIAPSFKLVDMPDARKRHERPTPLIGGLAIYFSIVLSILLLGQWEKWTTFLFVISGISLLGVIDDRYNLKPITRAAVQAMLATIMIQLADIRIASVGSLVGAGDLELGWLAIPFTIACVIGVINSINMIDGEDGLAGSVVLMTLLAMTYLAGVAGFNDSVSLLLIVVGSCLSFLCLNSPVFRERATVFMGDAGSMLLGTILVWFFVSLTQQETKAFTAVVAGWLFGFPLVDTVSVMVGRIRSKKSPFEAGRDHLHHLLIDCGLSKRRTLAIILSIHSLFVLTGVLFHDSAKAEPFLFWLFVFVVVIYHFVTPRILRRVELRLTS